jgi:hypothetical protein
VSTAEWKRKVRETWYSYAEISFTREQVFWFILPHRRELGDGRWPPRPGSDYVDTGGPGQREYAPFEAAVSVIAEVKARLEGTGEAGEALLGEVDAGIEEIGLLSRPARRALDYISGWKRRRISYSLWKWRQEHRHGVLVAAGLNSSGTAQDGERER